MGNVLRCMVAFVPLERCQRFLVGDIKEMPLDCTLDLSSRQLRRFPVSLCVPAFGDLVKLYLSENNLSNLPAAIKKLSKLQLLALDFNSFDEFPLAVCTLPQLNVLYLGNNHLDYIPLEVSKLTELKTLWLESNALTRFPSVICELPNLKTLHLGYNQIRSIPPELKQLDELRSIWLAGNLLNEFPPVLLEMQYLEVIDVDRNRISRFPCLSHLEGLKLIIYDHNPCVNVPIVAEGVRRVGRWADCCDDDDEEEEEEASKGVKEPAAEVKEQNRDDVTEVKPSTAATVTPDLQEIL